MPNQIKVRGTKTQHFLITVGRTDIPVLRARMIKKFVITLESCYAVVYAESFAQAIKVFEKNFRTRNIKSIEIV